MKHIAYIILFVTWAATSCDYLDVVPDNVPTIDYAFYDAVSAEKFLASCYSYLPRLGDPGGDPAILGDDGIWIHGEETWYASYMGNFYAYRLKQGLQDVENPYLNFWDGAYNGTELYTAIRDCNIFLENIPYVKTGMDEELRARWTAEVKVLKAYYHFYLLRMYGPIPYISKNLPIDAGVNEVRIFRDPFDVVVDSIASLIDEAVPDLPLAIYNASVEAGRISQPAALAIKAELLVVAASPLFNGNKAYENYTDSRGVQLFNTETDKEKWKRAAEACKNAIDTALLAGHKLYEFGSRYSVSDETGLAMTARSVYTQRWNQEVLWGVTFSSTSGNIQYVSLPFFTSSDVQNFKSSPILSPTLKMAELFYSNNGVPIEEDKFYDYDNRYAYSAAQGQKYYIAEGFETANLNQYREPRFYGNLGFDGCIWFGNGRYKDVDDGQSSDAAWTVNAKSGNLSGKTSSIRYSVTGYFPRKYCDYETATTSTGTVSFNRMITPVTRLSDLYLLYAEARNEYYGPDAEVYQYINLVREHAGLKGVLESWAEYSRFPDRPATQDGLRQIIQRERMIELAFEGKRFWDLRRWKIAEQELNGLVKGWNVNGKEAKDYYQVVTVGEISFMIKEYLWPIREYNLRVNSNLVQNPFWGN